MLYISFGKTRQGKTNLVGLGNLTVVCLLVLVALCLPELEFTPRPQAFTSQAKLAVGRRILASEGFRETLTSSDVTTIEMLESAEMRKRAMERTKVLYPDLSHTDVKIRATQNKGSAIYDIFATGEDPKYTKFFLDALLDESVIFEQQIYDQKHPENESIGAAAPAIIERASHAFMDNTGRYRIWKLWTDTPPRTP